MMLHGTIIGAGADDIRLTIEGLAPDDFVLYVGVRDEGGEHIVRFGPWQTLEKAREVAHRVAAEVGDEPKISWSAADSKPAPGTHSRRGWFPFKMRPLPSRRPCPACGGMMHYVPIATTFVTNRRLRVCRSCGHSDPKPVSVHSA
jgi:hypothetical protein